MHGPPGICREMSGNNPPGVVRAPTIKLGELELMTVLCLPPLSPSASF